MTVREKYDVVILGAGLAGLSLCRQLLLNSHDKTVLLVDNRADLPGNRQKVGESLVQVAGYYFTRILDLEEHLLREHYPKYNLRFHWKTPGRENRDLQDYSRSYIGKSSNVATYHLNRNKIEAYLLETALQNPNVSLCTPATGLQVDLSEGGLHRVRFGLNGSAVETRAEWLVDTTGRSQFLKKRRDMIVESPIRHGSSWCWVEGLVNIEKLTDLAPEKIRTGRDLQKQGLFPIWLATNHFCGEGFWFWVIPLKGLTSLGVVYDKAVFSQDKVNTPEKLLKWACEEFPLFARDLPQRKILDAAWFADFAYDCKQTISPAKWAISGFAGRFSDPLYSPGSDLIAYYNTMITDAMLESDPEELKKKTELYEALMKVVYDAYVPSYYMSYDTLGDQECFTFKYAWELAIYFAFYAFPFINGLFTNGRFIKYFFRKFAQLGPINRNLQKFLSDYYQWKKSMPPRDNPVANDFLELAGLKKTESSYYKVSPSVEQAEEDLAGHLQGLKDFARFMYAFMTSVVLGDRQVMFNRSYVCSIKLGMHTLNPEALRKGYQAHAGCTDLYDWGMGADAMEKFHLTAVSEMMS
jgi:2-polyprenyl-6-methoxyphenol hydroxylase-like FAD-dependent oxidoreductase